MMTLVMRKSVMSDKLVSHAGPRPPRIVVTASSAGGLQALTKILARLPSDFAAHLIVVQHRAPGPPYLLSSILAKRTALALKDAAEGDTLGGGTAYVARPESHIVVRPDGSQARRLLPWFPGGNV